MQTEVEANTDLDSESVTDEELTSLLDDETLMERLRSELAQNAAEHTRPTPTQEVRSCGCTENDHWGYRVIQTQANGSVLTEPIELLCTKNLLEANQLIEDTNKESGTYSVWDQVLSCGHSMLEFKNYWS